MSSSGIQQSNFRRYSRLILVLFVISWINLVVQAPVHAAMKQQAAFLGDMTHCHCPDTLCDTVLNLENQSAEVVHLTLDEIPAFQLAFTQSVIDPLKSTLGVLDTKYLKYIADINRPPPLTITRILLI